MTKEEFENKVAEYEAHLCWIAEQNWLWVAFMHTVVDSYNDSITSWAIHNIDEKLRKNLNKEMTLYCNELVLWEFEE